MMDSTKLSEAVRSGVATAMPDLRYEGQDSVIIPTKHWETLKNAGIELLKLLPDEDGNYNPELLGCLDGKGYPDLYEFSDKQVEAIETLGLKMIPVKNAYVVRNVLDAITGNTE